MSLTDEKIKELCERIRPEIEEVFNGEVNHAGKPLVECWGNWPERDLRARKNFFDGLDIWYMYNYVETAKHYKQLQQRK